MAKKKFKVNILSMSSIEQLKKDLTEYQNDLSRKCELIVKRLSDIARPVIEQNIAAAAVTYDSAGIESGADTSHNTTVKITSLHNYARADITVDGRDIIFIEFGAGVYYNDPPSPHPKGEQFNFIIGSYGKGYGKQKIWAYYNETGDLVFTHGVKATMPMYKAVMEVYQQAHKVVKEVFA